MKIGRGLLSGLFAIGGMALTVLGFGVDVIAEHPELVALGATAGGMPWIAPLATGAARRVRGSGQATTSADDDPTPGTS